MSEKTANINLTESQVKNLADFIELNLLGVIRRDIEIDNLYYVLDMCEAYRVLRETEIQFNKKTKENQGITNPEDKESAEKLGGYRNRTMENVKRLTSEK